MPVWALRTLEACAEVGKGFTFSVSCVCSDHSAAAKAHRIKEAVVVNVIEFPRIWAEVDASGMPTDLLAKVMTAALFDLVTKMDDAAKEAGLPVRRVAIRALPSPELVEAIKRPGAIRFEIDGAQADVVMRSGPVPKCPATALKEDCDRGCKLGQVCQRMPRPS